tara:strand:+ start:2264 stop:2767 length:504 start_codon:yes stop_codon:yes gene_type:complete
MKKLILLLLFIPLVSFGQDLAFIGEKSYPSTPEFRLAHQYDDLYISFIEFENDIHVIVKTEYIYDSYNPTINGKLILYLDDGNVVISEKPEYTDYVDESCISRYPLDTEQVENLIESNINTIRYNISVPSKPVQPKVQSRTAKNNSYSINSALGLFANELEEIPVLR